MIALTEKIKEIENQIEKALWEVELNEELEKALEIYQDAEAQLEKLGINADNPAYAEQQRVLSYCLMRQGNILRQMDKPQEALALGEREIAAARASGDEITLARSVMSNGTNLIVAGKIKPGLKMLDDARELFEKGESEDHRQGLGWYWILQADLVNAGLIEMEPAELVNITTRALDILKPIENWPGVARAYAGRARAYQKLGNEQQAVKDHQEQMIYESKVKPDKNKVA